MISFDLFELLGHWVKFNLSFILFDIAGEDWSPRITKRERKQQRKAMVKERLSYI